MKKTTASQSEADEGLKTRREKYSIYLEDFKIAEKKQAEHLKNLRTNGYTILKNAIGPRAVRDIVSIFTTHCRQGTYIQPARDLRNLADPKDWQQNNRFSAEDMAKGESWLKDKTSILQSSDPLLSFPDLLHASLGSKIIDIMGAYLGALPLMSFAKLRKSFANDLPLFDTELFHIDGNSLNMAKGLLLLSNMTPEKGAHEFVIGTHRTAEADGARFTRQEMIEKYGQSRIHTIYGNAGDMILEDTSGFHSAVRPLKGERIVAIFNYVLHPEYGYDQVGWPKCKVSKYEYNMLTNKQQGAAGELEIV